jgi:hypothetical protein
MKPLLKNTRKTGCGGVSLSWVVRASAFSLLSIFCAMALKAQSISITTPAPNATVNGFSGYSFQAQLTSAQAIVKVCYIVDSYPAYNPGIDAGTALGCSVTAPFSMPYNSFWNGNGSHQVVAKAYNTLGALVATSAAVPFTTGNLWPLSYISGLSVSTGTPVTSNWSGIVTVSPTLTGTGASDLLYFNLYVDGFLQSNCGNTTSACGSNPATLYADTTPFQNGNHNVCIVAWDNTAGTTYTGTLGGYNGNAGQWCRTISFQNGTLPNGVVLNTSAVYLAPGNTFTLTASGVLTAAGTLSSGIAGPVFLPCASTTLAAPTRFNCPQGVASVSTTGVVTAIGNGATQVTAMVPTVTGTDLAISQFYNNQVTSASHPFTQASVGSLVKITGGSCTAGIYQIIAVNIVSGSAELNTTTGAGPTNTSGCSFTYGPGHPIWVYVWPSNTLPHFGGAGQILPSYTPGTSFVPHCMFQSSYAMLLEQPYIPGLIPDIAASGLNCFEIGMNPNPPGNYSSLANYSSALGTYIAQYESILAGTNLKLGLIGDGMVYTTSNLSPQTFGSLYDLTAGIPFQWSTPAFQQTIAQWAAQKNVIGAAMVDENGDTIYLTPGGGPITYGGANSWLSQISASSGTCTGTTTGPWGLNSARQFIIHGSSVTNMNSVAPAFYTASPTSYTTNWGSPTPGTFTFLCTGVANGTYNSTNDPGFTLEPSGVVWQNNNTDWVHYNALESLISQANAVPGAFGLSYPIIGTRTYAGSLSILNFDGNGTYSTGGVANVAQYANIYFPHGSFEPYLISRMSASAINQVGDIGYILKSTYGTYNPSMPVVAETQSTFSAYAVPRYPVSVASCSGNTITFNSPHGIANIIPGMTRMYITGATDSGSPANSCNNNFYIYSAPTSTTLTVALAATDFTSINNTTNGGTITFQDGSTLTLSQINATGTINNCAVEQFGVSGLLCGDIMFAATASQNNFRKRGQTFTCSGCTGTGAASWNSRTFVLLPENLNLAANGNNHNNMHYREIPQLSAAGGTAMITPNDNYILGASGSNPQRNGTGDVNPAWSFGTCAAVMTDRGAGDRWYQIRPAVSGYSDQWGFTFTAGGSTQNLTTFASTQLSPGQSSMTPHFENGPAVPMFRAASNCDTIWNRYQKYILQPTLPSPDTGQWWIDCSARAGSYGDIAFCWNASDGPQTVTVNLSRYLQSGQQIIQQIVTDHSIGPDTILSAGTTSATVTLNPEDAVFFVFPVSFSSELAQPAISARLADVPNATDIVVRWAYDPYYLSVSGNTYDCGTGACTPPWDLNIGTVYYRVTYLGSNSRVLATSDVQTL